MFLIVDVWSAGCVLAELLLGQPIFPGDSGVDQLVEIIKVLGTPTRDQIKEMNPNYTEFKFPQIKSHPWQKVSGVELQFEQKASSMSKKNHTNIEGITVCVVFCMLPTKKQKVRIKIQIFKNLSVDSTRFLFLCYFFNIFQLLLERMSYPNCTTEHQRIRVRSVYKWL